VYQWYKNGVAAGTSISTYAAGVINNGDSVWCIVTSNAACLAAATAKSNVMHYAVTASVTPSIGITSNTPSPVCASTLVTFTATASGGGTAPAYQWYKDNISAGTNSGSYTAALNNGDSVWCAITSNSACVTTVSAKSNLLHYTVNPLVTPSVAVTASAASPICAGTNVTFTATAVNGGTTPAYQWYKNGIAAGTNSNSYAAGALNNGDSVWCVVASNAACVTGITGTSAKLKFTVLAYTTPSVTVSANTSAAICAGTKVTFTATPSNGGLGPAYQWYKNNTAVGTNASTYIDSTLKNNDSVWCLLTSNAACITAATASSSHLKFTVNALITASVSITSNTANTICAGSKILFTATIANGGTTPVYQWYKDNALVGNNAATYADSTLKNGDSIWCVITSNAVCVTPTTAASNKLKFTVNPMVTPSVTISANAASPINAGTKVTFTATPVNGGAMPTYQWYKDNVAVGANAATYADSALKNGDSVWCIVTSNALCTTSVSATSNKLKFAVNTAATVSVASSAASPICAGTKIAFIATVVNGGTTPVYQWYKDGKTVGSNSATYTDSALKNGDSVWCFITSNSPLAVPDTATSNKLKFTVNAPVTPAITISASSASTICAGTLVTFTATAVNGGTAPVFQWYRDNVATVSGASYSTAALANQDSIWCTLASNAACPTIAVVKSSTSRFTVNLLPVVSVSGAACAGSQLTLTSSTLLSQIVWERNDTIVATHKDTIFYVANGLTVAGYNGAGSAANQLNYPAGIYLDASKNIYIADELNNRIQKWAPGATSGTTVAGIGQAYATTLSDPSGVYIDASGNLYIADAENNRVQEWKAGVDSGITVAGGNGSGSSANQLNYPSGVFVDASHNIYVADEYNNRIQKWAPGATSGITVAGGSCCGGANNLYYPTSVYVDASGNIYIADLENERIQKWAPGATSGVTVAGGNGNGNAANQLSAPGGVFVDASNNIYVADGGNGRIQKWAPGAVSGVTVAGGNGFGTASNQLYEPQSVYVDAQNNVYVSDQYNSRVQEFIYKDSITTTFATASAGTYNAMATAKNGCTATTAGFVVNPLSAPSATITANTGTSISAGTKVTFTAAAVNGGAAPAYKWYKDNAGVGTSTATYLDSTLKNNDSVWCVLTSDATCLATTTAKSNVLKFVVGAPEALANQKSLGAANIRVHLYPNPSTTAAVLQLTGYVNKYAIIVFDMSGKPVWKTESAGDASITLPAQTLASGVYLVRIISDGDERTLKWIIGR
jgi:sugar lactone lactonase YvrE